jgi:hypothetical protein
MRTSAKLFVYALTALALLIGAATPARAADEPKRAVLLIKALSYEKAITTRSGDEVRLVVVYRAGDPRSEEDRKAWDKALRGLGDMKIQNKRITSSAVAVTPNLAKDLEAARPDVILVAEGLGEDLAKVRAVSQSTSRLTFGTSPGSVEVGLVLGVFMTAGKPQIVVNLKEAKRVNAEFQTALLRLAKVIR